MGCNGGKKVAQNGMHWHQKVTKIRAKFFQSKPQRIPEGFAHFMDPSNQVDTPLDKSRRINLIQDQSNAAYNKQIVVFLFDIVRVLAIQGISFRGHQHGKGNLLKTMHFVSRYCGPLKHWLDKTKLKRHHATYMSSEMQNEIIKTLGYFTRNRVIPDINNALAFSMMADTTTDASNKDQLSAVIGYVIKQEPVERLLRLPTLSDKIGGGHATVMLKP